jgi:hypothetical protein
VIAAIWLTNDKQGIWRIMGAASGIAAIVFIALAGIRAVEIQALVMLGMIALVLLRFNRRTLLLAFMMFGAAAALYATVPQVAERFVATVTIGRPVGEYLSPDQAVRLIAAMPMGLGFGTSTSPQGGIENYFVGLASDSGIPGVLLFTSLMIYVGVTAVRIQYRTADSTNRALVGAAAAFTFSLLVVMNTALTLDKPTVAFVFWTLAGLVVSSPPLLLTSNPDAATELN